MIKPILFNTDMVRALQTNRKTATRRVVKGYALEHLELDTDGSIIGVYDQFEGHVRPVMDYSPYHPGDTLYVRETWCKYGRLDAADRLIPETEKYYYRADGENPTPFNSFLVQHPGWDEYRETPVWHPSIHMPREAARIFLRVTKES